MKTKINEIRIYIGSRNYKEVNMMNIKKRVTNFLAVLLATTLFVSTSVNGRAIGDNTGEFVVTGGTYGVDYEYVSGTSPITYQAYGTNESYNTTANTPKVGGVTGINMDVLKIKTSKPLTITTNGKVSYAGIMIEAGVQADLTFDSVIIHAPVPVNIVTNTKEVNSYGRPILKDEDGNGISDYLEDPTYLHLTLADGSINELRADVSGHIGGNSPAIRCGEGSKLVIDDARRNVDVNGVPIESDQGHISRDATLSDGTVVKKGDRLTLLDSINPGQLTVYGGLRAAAIGGGGLESSGDMTFNGGNFYVHAYGPSESRYGAGAGIGGGHAGCGTIMTFNGGYIESFAAYHSAAIGGGCTYGGGMSNGAEYTYAFTDAYLSEYPLHTVAGDININGGYIKATGYTHGNAFGQGCSGNNNGKTIKITGGTLLPSSVPGWYDIGGDGGDVIVTGGSIRLSAPGKFQSDGNIAWGDLDKTIKVFMTQISLSGYNKPNMLVDGMKMSINGKPTNYGMPSYTDENGNLYFWLPNSTDGTKPEVRVELNMQDKDTGEKIETEPFFVTDAGYGSVLKQYVYFKVNESQITDENRLKKRYDGLSFSDAQQQAFLNAVVKDGIDVTIPENGKLDNISLMTIQSQRLTENLEVDETESITNGVNANVGKYQLTITSNQYASENGFKDAFWGHRCYYKYAEITPADSQTVVEIKKGDEVVGDDPLPADTTVKLIAHVSPADYEALTCEAPKGKVQFYINGKAYGDPVVLGEATSTGRAAGHKQSTAQITWTPTSDGGKFSADSIQNITAKYIPGEKDNFNKSENDNEFKIVPVEQGNEDNGGQPIKIVDDSTGSEILADDELEKIYGDGSKLEISGGDTDEDFLFDSSNPDIAYVDENGVLHIVGVGDVVIRVTRPGNGAYESLSQDIVIHAGKKKLTLDKVDILDKYYDGTTTAQIDPDSIVLGGLLKQDQDKVKEQLKFLQALFPNADVGDYSDARAFFELTGELAKLYYFEQENGDKGNEVMLEDSASVLRRPITPPETNKPGENPPSDMTPPANSIAVDSVSNQQYTGDEIEPPLVVRDGDRILVEGVDYIVEYKNNIDVGTADVTIKGIGNYSGTIDTTFKIIHTNVDVDGDGVPDINIDLDGDGEPDINIDTDGDNKPDTNIDTNDDGKPDINIDTDGDSKPDINIDTDRDGKPDINIDTDGDGKPDINIDIDGDSKPDINIDTDGDGKPDINIDTDGDGKPDVNIDTDGDGKADKNIVGFISTSDTNQILMYTWIMLLAACTFICCAKIKQHVYSK